MAISRMQQPQQIQGGLGSLTDPRFDQQAMYNEGGMLEQDRVRDPQRQGYFLGKLVKKAKRAVKKVTKSPIGKMAILGALGYGLGGAKFLGGEGIFAGGQGMNRFGNLLNLGRASGIGGQAQGKRGILAGLFNDADGKFSLGRTAFTGLGAASLAAPFLMGGGDDDENEEDIDRQDYAAQVLRYLCFPRQAKTSIPSSNML